MARLQHQVGGDDVLDRHAERLEHRDLRFRRAAGRPAEHDLSQLADDVRIVKRPSLMPSTTSPDSTRAAARESTNSRAARDQLRRHLALIRAAGADRNTCAPAATQPSSKTGVGDDVASTTRSASRTASSPCSWCEGRAACAAAISATKRSRLRWRWATRPARRAAAHLGVRLEVAARLHAAADDRQRGGVRLAPDAAPTRRTRPRCALR